MDQPEPTTCFSFCFVACCRPALLAAAENFTVLIKNNIRFPAFNFTRWGYFAIDANKPLISCCRQFLYYCCSRSILCPNVDASAGTLSRPVTSLFTATIKWCYSLFGFTVSCLISHLSSRHCAYYFAARFSPEMSAKYILSSTRKTVFSEARLKKIESSEEYCFCFSEGTSSQRWVTNT